MSEETICIKNYPIRVYSGVAGYYIGTQNENRKPNCRISGYFEEKWIAEYALHKWTFTFRDCAENNYCRGEHCLPVEQRR